MNTNRIYEEHLICNIIYVFKALIACSKYNHLNPTQEYLLTNGHTCIRNKYNVCI